MEDNTLRKSLADVSSAWLLPLEILELMLVDAHPQVLVRFGQTCKELHEYLLKSQSPIILEGLWYKSYTKHCRNEARGGKQMSRDLYLLRGKSLSRIARSMKFDIDDEPDVDKRYARQHAYHEDYDPEERVKLEPDAMKWKWNKFLMQYHDIPDWLAQYHTLTAAEKLAVKKFSKPKKQRAYNMPDLTEFSTISIYLMSLWLARKATVHCMSKCGEYVQPTLLHDLSIQASLELLLLCAIFKQEELYRVAIKEHTWQVRGHGERVQSKPEFREEFPSLTRALDRQESEVWKDTYSCKMIDWEKVHRDLLKQQRDDLDSKSRELEKMFGIQSSDSATKNS